jgi:enoyl-CoA hydratase/carnithine racemase
MHEQTYIGKVMEMKVNIKRIEPKAKITVQESAGLAIVTLFRPHLKNALNSKMWQELTEIGEHICDNPKNKVLVLRGSGNQFTAGSDIKEFHQMTVEEAEQAFVYMEKAISTFEKLPIPTVGVINGPAMGAGLELALSCDIRIGSEQAKMGIPVGRLGIKLNNKFVKRLVDLIGPSRTKDLVYTGRIFDAKEAYQLGMLNYLVEEKQLDRFAIEKARTIAEQSPASLLAVKQSVANCINSIEELWKTDNNFVDLRDFPEGIAAFVEKRKPDFKRRTN